MSLPSQCPSKLAPRVARKSRFFLFQFSCLIWLTCLTIPNFQLPSYLHFNFNLNFQFDFGALSLQLAYSDFSFWWILGFLVRLGKLARPTRHHLEKPLLDVAFIHSCYNVTCPWWRTVLTHHMKIFLQLEVVLKIPLNDSAINIRKKDHVTNYESKPKLF